MRSKRCAVQYQGITLNRSTDHFLILFPVGYPVNTGDKNREWWPFSVMTHKFKQATGLIFMTLNIFHIPTLAVSTLHSFNKISYHLQDENSLLLHLKREVSNMSQDSQSLHLSVVAKMETYKVQCITCQQVLSHAMKPV